MDFMTMKIEDIIKWCQEHNEVAWLKAEAQKKVEIKVYPRIKVERTFVDKQGNTYAKMVAVQDKSQEPTTEVRPIPFVSIKHDFCEKFMPDLVKPKEAKKPNMYDLIASL